MYQPSASSGCGNHVHSIHALISGLGLCLVDALLVSPKAPIMILTSLLIYKLVSEGYFLVQTIVAS